MKNNKTSDYIEEEHDWIYDNSPFVYDKSQKYFGFVYLITDLSTDKKYIGKKFFNFRRKIKKKDTRRTTFESDWKDYYGSSKELTKLVEEKGKDNFKREIIVLCKTAGEVNFSEVFCQFLVGVLESDDWLNDAIGKYKKANVKKYSSLSQIRNFFRE